MTEGEDRLAIASLFSETVSNYLQQVAEPLLAATSAESGSALRTLADIRLVLWYAESLLALYETALDFGVGSRPQGEKMTIIGVVSDLAKMPSDGLQDAECERISAIRGRARRCVSRTEHLYDQGRARA